MTIDPNSPAFAVSIAKETHVRCECGANMHGHETLIPSGGLPIRLHLAAMASDPPEWWMNQVENTKDVPPCGGLERTQTIARWKLMQADALLAEYNKEPKP